MGNNIMYITRKSNPAVAANIAVSRIIVNGSVTLRAVGSASPLLVITVAILKRKGRITSPLNGAVLKFEYDIFEEGYKLTRNKDGKELAQPIEKIGTYLIVKISK